VSSIFTWGKENKFVCREQSVVSQACFGMNDKYRAGKKRTRARSRRLGEFWSMLECFLERFGAEE
jgi:hypothetical protein